LAFSGKQKATCEHAVVIYSAIPNNAVAAAAAAAVASSSASLAFEQLEGA
jgi:hypothetical protein